MSAARQARGFWQGRRGFTETIRAAIWLSDMRGFTRLADTFPPATLVATLNRYFDCQVPPILKHGGQVLKLKGDGLLAIFPLVGDADPHAVYRAARGGRRGSHSALQPAGSGPRYGVALHIGELFNTGAANRLDFTLSGRR